MNFQSFAIVPAAGRSRRMGRQKLLLQWRGKTVLERVLWAWWTSHVGHVVVVVRQEDQQVIEVCRRAGVELVLPATDPPEMKDSICYALDYLSRHYALGPNDVWMLAPADLPTLEPSAIDAVLAAHRPAASEILVASYPAGRGHPALFPWGLAAEVELLADDEGVDTLLRRHPVRSVTVSAGRGEQDLDTPEDYRRLLEESGDGR